MLSITIKKKPPSIINNINKNNSDVQHITKCIKEKYSVNKIWVMKNENENIFCMF